MIVRNKLKFSLLFLFTLFPLSFSEDNPTRQEVTRESVGISIFNEAYESRPWPCPPGGTTGC